MNPRKLSIFYRSLKALLLGNIQEWSNQKSRTFFLDNIEPLSIIASGGGRNPPLPSSSQLHCWSYWSAPSGMNNLTKAYNNVMLKKTHFHLTATSYSVLKLSWSFLKLLYCCLYDSTVFSALTNASLAGPSASSATCAFSASISLNCVIYAMV